MTIDITGGTGNVGQPRVAKLRAAGCHLRAITRSPTIAAFPDGVEVVSGWYPVASTAPYSPISEAENTLSDSGTTGTNH